LLIEHEFRVPVTWVCPWDPDQDGRSDDLVALEQLQIDLASCLNPLAYAMLLSYGNTAMRDVIIKGGGRDLPNLAVLAGLVTSFIILSIVMMRRKVARIRDANCHLAQTSFTLAG
jgi:hypothetical protein